MCLCKIQLNINTDNQTNSTFLWVLNEFVSGMVWILAYIGICGIFIINAQNIPITSLNSTSVSLNNFISTQYPVSTNNFSTNLNEVNNMYFCPDNINNYYSSYNISHLEKMHYCFYYIDANKFKVKNITLKNKNHTKFSKDQYSKYNNRRFNGQQMNRVHRPNKRGSN